GAGGGSFPLNPTKRTTPTTSTAPAPRKSFPRFGWIASASSISDDAEDSVEVVDARDDIVWAIVLAAAALDNRRPLGTGAVTRTSPTIALRKSSMLWKRAAGSFASDFMIAAAMWGGAFGAKSVSAGGSSSMCLANSAPTPSALKGGRPDSISNRMTPSE